LICTSLRKRKYQKNITNVWEKSNILLQITAYCSVGIKDTILFFRKKRIKERKVGSARDEEKQIQRKRGINVEIIFSSKILLINKVYHITVFLIV